MIHNEQKERRKERKIERKKRVYKIEIITIHVQHAGLIS